MKIHSKNKICIISFENFDTIVLKNAFNINNYIGLFLNAYNIISLNKVRFILCCLNIFNLTFFSNYIFPTSNIPSFLYIK